MRRWLDNNFYSPPHCRVRVIYFEILLRFIFFIRVRSGALQTTCYYVHRCKIDLSVRTVIFWTFVCESVCRRPNLYLSIARHLTLNSSYFCGISSNFQAFTLYFVPISFLFYQWGIYRFINCSSSWFVVLFCSPLILTYCSDVDEFMRSSVGLCIHSFHDVLSLVNVSAVRISTPARAQSSLATLSRPYPPVFTIFSLYHKLIIAKHCMTHRCIE